MRGQRVAFTGPFRVFLFANMLFFAAQSLTDASVVGTSLQSHLHEQDWSGIAQRLVAWRLVELRTTLELYAPVFDRAVVLNAKSLIILMVLPFTGALSLTFLRARRPFVAHAVFALHFYAFLMILLCALLFAEAQAPGWAAAGMRDLDKPLFALLLAASAVYLYLATGVAYGCAGLGACGQGGGADAGRRRDDLGLPLRDLPDHALHHGLTPLSARIRKTAFPPR